MQENLFSVRMRAAQGSGHEDGGNHISGAEKIVPANNVPETLKELYTRACQHKLGPPDFINLSIEHISNEDIIKISSLPLYTVHCRHYKEGLVLAHKTLALAGIKNQIIEKAFHCLLHDQSSRRRRGAVLMDTQSGHQLEPDQNRGVRASKMDYSQTVHRVLPETLNKFGLNNGHVQEALCLASKVASIPGVMAELCWSDDPEYTAGYVAAGHLGYIRFPHLKKINSTKGGRVFFIDPRKTGVQKIIKALEQTPYIITELGPIHQKKVFERLVKELFNYAIFAGGSVRFKKTCPVPPAEYN